MSVKKVVGIAVAVCIVMTGVFFVNQVMHREKSARGPGRPVAMVDGPPAMEKDALATADG